MTARLETLTAYIDNNCAALIECDNGHFGTLPAHTLRDICIERGWGDKIEDITPHLKCRQCDARAKKVWPQRVVGLGR